MADNNWHLSKRVPIGIIIAFAISVAGFVWNASSMDSRTLANANSISKLELKIDRSNDSLMEIKSSVARIEGALGVKKR